MGAPNLGETAHGVYLVDPVTGNAAPSGSSTSPMFFSPAPLPTGTDRSGPITAGGTAQVLAAANTSRAFLKGQNTSAGDLWIREVGSPAAVGGTASYKVVSGATFSINTQNAISIIGATTGQTFAATEG